MLGFTDLMEQGLKKAGHDVKVVVNWQASVWEPPSPKSKLLHMDAFQTWEVVRSGNALLLDSSYGSAGDDSAVDQAVGMLANEGDPDTAPRTPLLEGWHWSVPPNWHEDPERAVIGPAVRVDRPNR